MRKLYKTKETFDKIFLMNTSQILYQTYQTPSEYYASP